MELQLFVELILYFFYKFLYFQIYFIFSYLINIFVFILLNQLTNLKLFSLQLLVIFLNYIKQSNYNFVIEFANNLNLFINLFFCYSF